MAFKLPTREEINAKIDEKGVESLSKLEEFVYDEEPDIQNKPHLWREQLEEAIEYCIKEREKAQIEYTNTLLDQAQNAIITKKDIRETMAQDRYGR